MFASRLASLTEYPHRQHTGDKRLVFRGALLMQNLLGLSEQVWLAGFWLNSGLQGEARANNTIDTSSPALQYNHGLPRPVYWVLWLWQRLRGEVLVNDKRVLLTRHRNGYQLLLRNVVVLIRSFPVKKHSSSVFASSIIYT